MPLTPYTPSFKAALMAKPETASYLNSMPEGMREKLIQMVFTDMIVKNLLKMNADAVGKLKKK